MSVDRKLTPNQVQRLMNSAYDHIEDISLSASKETLSTEFGFTDEQWNRFKELYLYKFGEKASEYIVKTRSFISKKK